MRTDCHAHVFPPRTAPHAVAFLGARYGVACAGNGTLEDLLERERRAGMERCVILCAAATPGQVVAVNDFALSLQRAYPQVAAFGTIHPAFPAWEKELERLKAAGIRGLKIHPAFQRFSLDDPRLPPLMEAAQDDFCLLFHVGDGLPPERNPSCPSKLAALLDRFPRLRCVAAHLGGYLQWEHALRVLAGRDLWLDTSSCVPLLEPALLRTLLRKHPSERILFGSDYPLYDPADALERLQRAAGLADAALERYCANADALFSSVAAEGDA